MNPDFKPRIACGAATLIALVLAGCGGPVNSRADATPATTPALLTMPAADAAALAPRARGDASAPAAEDALSLKDQVAQLRRELADLRRIVARLPSAAAVADEGPDPRRDPTARAEAERAQQQRLAIAEAAFRREPYDLRASQTQADSVRAGLRQGSEAIAGHLGSVDCRGQSCRVELNAAPHSRAMQELPLALAHLGAGFSNMTAGQIDRGDGRTIMVMYLTR
jgi:hypothetical protein